MRTEGLSILAALAFHVGILIAARAMPPLTLSASEHKKLDTIDIELPPSEPVALAVREPAPVTATPEAPREPERQPDARVAARTAPNPNERTQPVNPNERSTEPSPQPEPAPTQKGSQFDELPDERRGVLGVPGPGLGGNSVWTMPGVVQGVGTAPAPAPTVAPKARPVDKDIAGQVMREALAGRDKDLGLDLPAAGTVASAVRSAVQSADLPDNARGTIEFRLGPSGQLLGVRVLSATAGGAEAWDRAAHAAAAALAGRGLSMAQYTKGATITVDVSSNLQAPAGSKGGLQGAGVAFDISNIGAHATKHVRTSFRVAANR